MNTSRRPVLLFAVLLSVPLAVGCHALRPTPDPLPIAGVPKELEKTTHPTYIVEPPDILLIEGYKGVPKGPHVIEPLDVLAVDLADAPANAPLRGLLTVDPEGTLNLGPAYGGSVSVAGKSVPEAKLVIEKFLAVAAKLKAPVIELSLAQSRAIQRVSGAHLVQPDGTVNLGTYGSVMVTGLTMADVKKAIEAQLALKLQDPEVSVAIQGFNSKVIYVVSDGGGSGQSIVRLPCTGNETVLDAISQVNGLSSIASTRDIWIARPSGSGCQRLPVNWNAVVSSADPSTNYQLLPGDRVYVAAQKLVAIDIRMGRLFAPVERLLGIILLGNGAVRTLSGQGFGNNNNGGF